MVSAPKTIITLGYHNPEGGRHWVIKHGLIEHSFHVIECVTTKKGLFPKYADLWRQYRKIRKECDHVVLVPFLGHYIVPLAWALTRRPRRKLLFDCFISLYDTDICDRKRFAKWHPRAWLSSFMDWFSCTLADAVIMDTPEHKEYLIQRYRIPPDKILVSEIGCRTDIFGENAGTRKNKDRFTVEFHGLFIPLQGIETILHAARILEDQHADVHFILIGKGQTFPEMQKLTQDLELTNVTFTGFMPLETIPKAILNADVCLGIFGTTEKADRVIPHKSYEIICCGSPQITGDTTAARRAFQNGQDSLLTKPGDANALANSILRLKSDESLRHSIAQKGRGLFLEKYVPTVIVSEIIKWLKESSSQG